MKYFLDNLDRIGQLVSHPTLNLQPRIGEHVCGGPMVRVVPSLRASGLCPGPVWLLDPCSVSGQRAVRRVAVRTPLPGEEVASFLPAKREVVFPEESLHSAYRKAHGNSSVKLRISFNFSSGTSAIHKHKSCDVLPGLPTLQGHTHVTPYHWSRAPKVVTTAPSLLLWNWQRSVTSADGLYAPRSAQVLVYNLCRLS